MRVKAPRRFKVDLVAEATRSARNRVEIKDPIVKATEEREVGRKPAPAWIPPAEDINGFFADFPPLKLYGE